VVCSHFLVNNYSHVFAEHILLILKRSGYQLKKKQSFEKRLFKIFSDMVYT